MRISVQRAVALRPGKIAGVRSLQHDVSQAQREAEAPQASESLAPTKKRGGSKVWHDVDEAVADIKSGSLVLSAGFGLCGVAGKRSLEDHVCDYGRRTTNSPV